MSIPVSTVAAEDAPSNERAIRHDRKKGWQHQRSTIGLHAFLFCVSVWVLACVTGFETLKSLPLSEKRTWF